MVKVTVELNEVVFLLNDINISNISLKLIQNDIKFRIFAKRIKN